mmetsp:Transcript_489/g.1995  ORF Transcript_489/g.1995 Transcript_489/m.1995 type:complete len:224 (-) Transcript_489:32-703(-)
MLRADPTAPSPPRSPPAGRHLAHRDRTRPERPNVHGGGALRPIRAVPARRDATHLRRPLPVHDHAPHHVARRRDLPPRRRAVGGPDARGPDGGCRSRAHVQAADAALPPGARGRDGSTGAVDGVQSVGVRGRGRVGAGRHRARDRAAHLEPVAGAQDGARDVGHFRLPVALAADVLPAEGPREDSDEARGGGEDDRARAGERGAGSHQRAEGGVVGRRCSVAT